MEQRYVLRNCESFEPKDIFECGQCFRWDRQDDGSYTGIFGNNVLNVKKEIKSKNNANIIFSGICDGDIEKVCRHYFDLDRNYAAIKGTLSKVDANLALSIQYGKGIRILNQDLWETIISFITSANNNIPRIKGILNRMSQKYGNRIDFRGESFFTFPTADRLENASLLDLRALGLGFRDKYIYDTTKMIINNDFDIDSLYKEPDTASMRNKLLSLSGVGPKVADCILLFSTLKRLDVFPIDVWVRRVMNELYIHNPDETKVSKKDIEKIATEKFGNLQGMAQQYLFYWKRES